MVALNYDFAILGASTYAARSFQGLAKFLEVIVFAYKSGYKRYLLAASGMAVEPYA